MPRPSKSCCSKSRRETVAEGKRSEQLQIEAIYPLSPLQKGMLFHSLDESTDAYLVQRHLEAHGDLDVELFVDCWRQLVQRHEILRSAMTYKKRDPLQVILRHAQIEWERDDWRQLGPGEQESALQTFLVRDRERGFNLTRAPLMRMALFRTGAEVHQLVWTFHHILLDGSSITQLVREFLELYHGTLAGRPVDLPPAAPYRQYIAWLQAQNQDHAEAFWRHRLAGFESPTELPRKSLGERDRAEGSEITTGASRDLALTETHMRTWGTSARRSGLTLNTLTLGAWALLLSAYSGRQDVAFGTVMAGRPPELRGASSMVGLLISTLPLRVQIDLQQDRRDWLRGLQGDQADLWAYSYSSLGDIQKWSDVPAGQALFDSLFVFENYAGSEGGGQETDALRLLDRGFSERVNYSLTAIVWPGEQPRLRLMYDPRVFDPATIDRLLLHWRRSIESLARRRGGPLGEIGLLDATERHQQLVAWNDTVVPEIQAESVLELVAERVSEHPDQPALRYADGTWTYGELNRDSDHLARRLMALGVMPEDRVGLLLDRSAQAIVSILGILKTGAAYVPLEPEWPDQRLAWIATNAGLAALVTEGRHRHRLGDIMAETPHIDLDDPVPEDTGASDGDTAAVRRVHGAQLAYVMYTSGSTGKPKGVAIPHRAIVRLVHGGLLNQARMGDCVAQGSTLAFDASTYEIWTALAHGAELVGLSREESLSPQLLARRIQDDRYHNLFLTPAIFHQMALVEPNMFGPVGVLSMGGQRLETIPTRHVLTSRTPPRHLLNAYGPTEATTFVSFHSLSGPDDLSSNLPIGRPIPNTELLVLDHNLRLVPLGARGRLFLGGEGLARGYFQRPGRTASSFIPHPFSSEPGARLYDSGDLASLRQDGAIEFHGRIDHQVKIRGLRIEPGEIENTLSGHPAVARAVVMARDDGAGDQRLVAYLVPTAQSAPGAFDKSGLREDLSQQLPDFMVPAAFVILDELPTNINGKVDLRALPAPERSSSSSAAPNTPEEEALCEIWSQVLQVDDIGLDDNYFELGGDSILAIQIVSRAHAMGFALRTQQLFLHPTVRRLAALVEEARQPSPTAPQGPVVGELPLTPTQRWFLDADPVDPHHFNMSILVEVHGSLDSDILDSALRCVTEHHDGLRMRAVRRTRGWEARLDNPGEESTLEVVDLSDTEDPDQALAAHAAESQASLDLEHGPISKLILFRGSTTDSLLWIVHHLAIDFFSWRVLLEDLETAYQTLQRGGEPRLPAKTTSLSAWADALTGEEVRRLLAADTDFWCNEIAGLLVPLPRDGQGVNTLDSATLLMRSFDRRETASLLQGLPRVCGAQMREAVLMALVATLTDYAGGPLTVTLEGHGREDSIPGIDLSRTVGWFTTLYPLRFEPQDPDPLTAVATVQRRLREVPNGGLGFLWSQHVAGDPRLVNAKAAMEVGFNYLGQAAETQPEGLFSSPLPDRSPTRSPRAERNFLLEWTGIVIEGQLQVIWGYGKGSHHAATLERLANTFDDHLRALIAAIDAAIESPPDAFIDTELVSIEPAERPRLLGQVRAERPGGAPAIVEAICPLTPLQMGMVFHSLRAQGAGLYVVQQHWQLSGPIDTQALRTAWKTQLQRHEVLRMAVATAWEPEALGVLFAEVDMPWVTKDLRGLAPAEQEQRVTELLAEDRRIGFDLARAPLTRVMLLHLADDVHRLIWSFHHMLLDGWSASRVVQEFFMHYSTLAGGESFELPTCRPYRDYLTWLQQQDLGRAEAFWRQHLAGCRPAPRIPPRSNETSGDQHEAILHLDADEVDQWTRLAARRGWTLNTLTLGAWAWLRALYEGRRDTVVGTVLSVRPPELEGSESLVGLFINTLPVRFELARDMRACDLFTALFERQLELWKYGYAPLVDIQRWSGHGADRPLFDNLFVFENYPKVGLDSAQGQEDPEGSGFQFEEKSYRERTSYPLNLLFWPGSQPWARLFFDPETYDGIDAQRILRHFRTLLRQLTEDLDRPLETYRPWSVAEHHLWLHEWNDLRRPLPELSIRRLFREQVERHPEATALVAGDVRLSYRELAESSARLAARLSAAGIGPEDRVGVALPRGLPAILAIVATVEAGAAYVPLAPDLPRERITFMASDAGVCAVISTGPHRDQLPTTLPFIDMDDATSFEGPNPQTVERSSFDSGSHLAYIMYTSGSTGRPKGVAIPQEGIVRLVREQAYHHFETGDTVGQVITLSFDVSTFEIWGALLNGCALVVLDQQNTLSPERLRVAIHEHGIDVLALPTAVFNQLAQQSPESFGGVRDLVVAGQRIDPNGARRVTESSSPPRRLINAYGPTESTTFATAHEVVGMAPDDSDVPIGRPLTNTTAYVLDHGLRVVPSGTVGELCIGGTGLARTYWGRPGLTAAAFVPDPFSARPGDRLYRTGDLARMRFDGVIEFLGRIDDQVKIRGFRIEPGEITATLTAHPKVDEAAVLVRRRDARDPQLVAHVACGGQEPPSVQDLRHFLGQRLPEYMIPAQWAFLETLPKNRNGKVDSRALATVDPSQANSPKAPPRDDMERELVGIWQELLELDTVGIDDSFFELGGHSLLAMRMIHRLKSAFGVELPLATLLQANSIAGLAMALRHANPEARRQVVVSMGGNTSGQPFFCVHPGMGEVLCYSALASHMGDRPFYGLRDPFLDRTDEEPMAIEARAAHYVEALLRVQSEGPFSIGGFSFGGILAYEMAHQLEERGHQVDLVALIDSGSPWLIQRVYAQADDALLLTIIASELGGSGNAEGGPDESLLEELRQLDGSERIAAVKRRFERSEFLAPGFEPEMVEQQLRVFRERVRSSQRYSPPPIAGRTIFLAAEGTSDVPTLQPHLEAGDRTMGWSPGLRHSLETYSVSGMHGSLLAEPHVSQLASLLKTCLDSDSPTPIVDSRSTTTTSVQRGTVV